MIHAHKKHWRSCIVGDTADEFRARNREHAAGRARRLPESLQLRILAGWDERYGIRASATNGSPVARANAFAAAAVRDFGDARAGLAYDETAIREHAENYATLCARMATREQRAGFAQWFGIDPPAGKLVTDDGACKRMDDPMWWRRQLRKVWTRRAEDGMRRAGVIRKGRAPYASDEAVRHRAARQRRTREWLESRVMVNGEGEQLELLKLADRSIANPALRRGEFMCRMRGFEEIAADLGHVALFFTLTTPSKFHAQLSKGGANPAHSRETVRDGQKWLLKMWSRARAQLARLSIQFYGFRVAEPHHDATPHWHAVFFVGPDSADLLQWVLSKTWLSEFGDESGASDVRCKCERIEPEKGSATGYVAKYVSKNIDGAGAIGDATSDETGAPVSEGVARVAAWASCHGIRQFQQIGGPPVGLWRELRRVREAVESPLERVREVVSDEKDWAGFICALAGHDGKSGRKVRMRPNAMEGLHGVEVLPGRVRAGGEVHGAVPVLGGNLLPEPSGRATAEIDLARASRRVACVAEKYSRRLTRVPMVRFRRLAKRQWSKKCGPVMAWDSRPATPEEMPAAWVERSAPRATDTQGREVLAVTRYGETPAERACGVVAFGLLGRWASMATRRHRWRIEKREAPASAGRAQGRALCGTAVPASLSSIFSNLGPVAITVRASNLIAAANPQYEWVATVPLRDSSRASGTRYPKGRGPSFEGDAGKPLATGETGRDRPAASDFRGVQDG